MVVGRPHQGVAAFNFFTTRHRILKPDVSLWVRHPWGERGGRRRVDGQGQGFGNGHVPHGPGVWRRLGDGLPLCFGVTGQKDRTRQRDATLDIRNYSPKLGCQILFFPNTKKCFGRSSNMDTPSNPAWDIRQSLRVVQFLEFLGVEFFVGHGSCRCPSVETPGVRRNRKRRPGRRRPKWRGRSR